MKKVLVAPLDWGLGHASRCIPLINVLLQKKCEVMIAGSGRALELLKTEFPSLKHFTLVAYDPHYPSKGSMMMKMAMQLPRFMATIRKEHLQIENIVDDEKIDIVISDNRFGCWSSKATSVFITHQSNILMPKRFGWLANLVRLMNHRAMKKFSVCWIPDLPGEDSLSGVLSEARSEKRKVSFRYIGVLSRFTNLAPRAPHKEETPIDLLCIFSGPEPQRTILEKLVVQQLNGVELKTVIVRGVPEGEGKLPLKAKATVIDFANTEELQQLIHQSEVILARSGFSTVMDLATLKKKAIFIPTPGQTEQEYLARKLSEEKIAYSVSQKNFNLATAMKAVVLYKGFEGLPADNNLLHQAVDTILRNGKVH
jgi:UDP-N-acetylglucosamine transferase subunit ALG13